MQGIFINYRREDSEGYAITLQDRLAKHFGDKQLFMDVDDIEPGLDFMQAIEKSLSSCQVVLVLIGERWLDVMDKQGNRRLENPNDPLRIEIETALKSDARVIPILLHGTPMPASDKLPESLAPLTRRHAIEISSSRRDYDLERLFSTLEKIPGLKPLAKPVEKAQPAPRRSAFKNGLVGAGIVLLLLVTLGLFMDEEDTASPAVESATLQPTIQPPSVPTPTLASSSQAATVNLSGTWYDDGGTRFDAIQKGNKFIATGFNIFGMATKQMHGTVRGDTLFFTLQEGFLEMDGSGTLNEDGQHFDYTLVQGNYSEGGQLHLDHTRN